MNTTATLEPFSDALAAVGIDPHSVDVSLYQSRNGRHSIASSRKKMRMPYSSGSALSASLR
jgi:hypothetical protein